MNRSNSFIKGTTTNTLVYDGQKTVVGSRQNNIYPITAGSVNAGFNYAKGTQDSYTHTSLDYRMLNEQVSQYIPSSLTDVRQASAALFASWTRMFGKLSLSVGARYEYVDYDYQVNGKRDEEVSRCDHLLTPDVSLIYSFNDDAQICLSYKLATVKPPYSQLTSSLSYTELHEIEGGNPALRDRRQSGSARLEEA